jgi:large conductance mechanosensitive channel
LHGGAREHAFAVLHDARQLGRVRKTLFSDPPRWVARRGPEKIGTYRWAGQHGCGTSAWISPACAEDAKVKCIKVGWGEVAMLQGFKQFILRGNVLDLAVAVVMGVAFGAVVTALVKDIITPFIAAIVGKPDFSAIEFTINGSKFPIGDFINAVISFILIAAAVYFFIVLPMNTLLARMRRGEAAPDPTTKKCPECLSDVPIAARRCAFCTSPLTEATTR